MSIKYIDIKEFREQGYLQELNRQFLHPLGLALEVVIDDDGTERLGGIWDYREEDEGIYYDISNSDKDRIERFWNNFTFIQDEMAEAGCKRKKKLGFIEEPILVPTSITKGKTE